MKIYCDGSARPNPGPGGYGIVVLDDEENLIDCFSSRTTTRTTNNIQELEGLLQSFLRYGVNPYLTPNAKCSTVYCDSSYAVQTFTEWMFNWQRNGWMRTASKKPISNLDIIQKFYKHWKDGYRIQIERVPGHSNIFWNEIADKLASGALTPEEVKAMYGKK